MESPVESPMPPFAAPASQYDASFGVWISVDERLPEDGDYSVLAYWPANDGMDMVHVQSYFSPITNGRDEHGELRYTRWYLSQGVSHWMPMPPSPEVAK